MADGISLITIAKIFAVLWHVMAFAGGFAFVAVSYAALFGLRTYDRSWTRAMRLADLHLWLSGIAIVACAIALTGPEKVFANPKLWTKIVVVSVWTMSTIALRQQAAAWIASNSRWPVIAVSSISLASWVYGAFLGCAKDLSFGAASFSSLASGFAVTLAGCALAGLLLETRKKSDPRSALDASPA